MVSLTLALQNCCCCFCGHILQPIILSDVMSIRYICFVVLLNGLFCYIFEKVYVLGCKTIKSKSTINNTSVILMAWNSMGLLSVQRFFNQHRFRIFETVSTVIFCSIDKQVNCDLIALS